MVAKVAVILVFLVPMSAGWAGYVTKCLWRWFASGIFNARALSWPEAIGIGLLAAHLTHRLKPRDDDVSWLNIFVWWFTELFSQAYLLALGWTAWHALGALR